MTRQQVEKFIGQPSRAELHDSYTVSYNALVLLAGFPAPGTDCNTLEAQLQQEHC